MKIPILLLLTSLFLLSGKAVSQSQTNPFELPNPPNNVQVLTTDSIDPNNPFEIPIKTSDNISNHQVENTKTREALQEKSASTTEIGIAVFLLVFLSFLLTLFRGLFQDYFDSVIRDRKFNQLFRRMDGIWGVPNMLFYSFFAINLAVFAFFSAGYFNFLNDPLTYRNILVIAGLIGAFFLGKHVIIENLGRIFGIENEANRYSLLLMMFSIIAGILMTPFNVLILLGPTASKSATILCGIAILSLFVGLLVLRAISIGNRFLSQNTFHFFMYLCTIEIAPLFIIAKMMM